eukprot:6460551-Amphidinium_carterae.6
MVTPCHASVGVLVSLALVLNSSVSTHWYVGSFSARNVVCQLHSAIAVGAVALLIARRGALRNCRCILAT